jgi:hypothetical protein
MVFHNVSFDYLNALTCGINHVLKVDIKNKKRVSVCLSVEQLRKVELMAIEMSKQAGKAITVSEAIRKAVEICYPLAEQKVMFE